MKVNRVGGQESAERRMTSGERAQGGGGAGGQGRGAPPWPEPNVTEIDRRVSLGAALLFFVGLFAAAGAVVMGVVFFWPWLVRGAEWVGWVVGAHPGLVMVGLVVVAVGALRLARWADEKPEEPR